CLSFRISSTEDPCRSSSVAALTIGANAWTRSSATTTTALRRDRHSFMLVPARGPTMDDARFPTTAPVQFTRFTGGGIHLLSSIAGFGQYTRMVMLNSPAAAGSQLASLSLPGESFWTYTSSEPSGSYLRGIQAAML